MRETLYTYDEYELTNTTLLYAITYVYIVQMRKKKIIWFHMIHFFDWYEKLFSNRSFLI